METHTSRRDFLKASSLAAGGLLMPAECPAANEDRPIKVVVWDERQPAQKEAYDNFLGNAIAGHLRQQPGLEVASVALDDPEQGLAARVLDGCRVLIWWGHVRQDQVAPEVGRKVVEKIKAGELSLIALHSAHWSTPFVEAMNERARMDLRRRIRAEGLEGVEVREAPPPKRYAQPKADERVTPFVDLRKFPDGPIKADLHLPYCCFPAYRTDGKPSRVRVLRPEHPILAGVPREFTIARTEMYDEPFHVPAPDAVLFEERWEDGAWFRSGMLWNLGGSRGGHVFYFRPGHETFPVFRDPNVLTILTNAVRWLALPYRDKDPGHKVTEPKTP